MKEFTEEEIPFDRQTAIDTNSRFYIGTECIRKDQHKTIRYTANGCCAECSKLATANYKLKHPNYFREKRKESYRKSDKHKKAIANREYYAKIKAEKLAKEKAVAQQQIIIIQKKDDTKSLHKECLDDQQNNLDIIFQAKKKKAEQIINRQLTSREEFIVRYGAR